MALTVQLFPNREQTPTRTATRILRTHTKTTHVKGSSRFKPHLHPNQAGNRTALSRTGSCGGSTYNQNLSPIRPHPAQAEEAGRGSYAAGPLRSRSQAAAIRGLFPLARGGGVAGTSAPEGAPVPARRRRREIHGKTPGASSGGRSRQQGAGRAQKDARAHPCSRSREPEPALIGRRGAPVRYAHTRQGVTPGVLRGSPCFGSRWSGSGQKDARSRPCARTSQDAAAVSGSRLQRGRAVRSRAIGRGRTMKRARPQA